MITRILEWPVLYELSQKNILTAGMRRIVLALLRREWADGPGSRVVEVGCGTGLYLTALGPQVFGTDISVAYVRFLKGKGRRVFASDAPELALGNGSASLIYCINGLYYLDDHAITQAAYKIWWVWREAGELPIVVIFQPELPWNRVEPVLKAIDRGGHGRKREGFKEFLARALVKAGARFSFTDSNAFCTTPRWR